jgi:ADP-heptose:LPS heptosyltransferase
MTKEIINYINKELDIDITKKRKTNQYVFARTLYYKLCKEYTNLPLTEIGAGVNKDHCSVLHNLKNFDEVIKRPKLKKIYDTFKLYPIEEDRLQYTDAIKLNEQLRNELLETKQKYTQLVKTLQRQDISKHEQLLKDLTPEQLDLVYTRLQAIVKMIP